ncbi:LCP family protein [Bifidobacterium pullorum subsp. saeculare]|uniref:LCP family protein n=1 Tax=Bifidobacterium pullorum subsp. saeculare TaxID=78257 RepID=A0A938WWU5_9BIFI|nr:LCP family protein [Bifidobacterium pullorum]MBM6699045.1 LCP family protein [Bifidobacterium pullorum subsp. saeculare]
MTGQSPRDIPPSFVPSAGRRRQMAGGDPAGPGAQPGHDRHGAMTPPSYAPSPRRSASGAQGTPAIPPSVPPAARAARRSGGSSRTVPASVPPARAAQTGRSRSGAVAMAAGRGAGVPSPAPRGRRHRARTVVAAALAVLVAAMALLVFGAWNWVDGKLTREDWLTDHRAGPGTAWLLLGSDERDNPEETGITGYRTDTILVLTKPSHGAVSLISIPRDSLTQVDGRYMKINAVAQAAGPKALVGQVETITGNKIDHVAKIKFDGLQQVVDALGGVELCYDQTVSDPLSGLDWQAGCHLADGATALAFSRMRYSDARGDFGRAERQRQVIGAIAKKALGRDVLANPAKLMRVGDAALGAVSVDEKTNPYTLAMMLLAFRDATGANGISGSVYWTDPDYRDTGVGSAVLLDKDRNLALFESLAEGTHAPGAVGSLAES